MHHFSDGRDWFFHKRFGMFVHWGVYSVRGWHEQEMWRDNISREKYTQYAKEFNPMQFSPDEWLDLAEEAGMEYICFTTKHHDGFCMWDTKLTDYNIMHTPYKKDILAMLAEACHKRNFPICLYYSCVDWHHPNYPNFGRHHELDNPQPDDLPDMARYLEYLKGQMRELCTNYGEISGIFWDVNVPEHQDPSINQIVRELQPNAIINDRGYDEGDYGTPERDEDRDGRKNIRRYSRPTEACQSVGMESWGYRVNESYFTPKYLMQSMSRVFSMDGNYLLNVGPKANGQIPGEAVRILKTIGPWLHSVKEAYYETEPASHILDDEGLYATRRGSTLYVTLFRDPIGSAIQLPPLVQLPRRATLLNDGTPLTAVRDRGTRHWRENLQPLKITGIPSHLHSDQVMVLKLEFEEGCL